MRQVDFNHGDDLGLPARPVENGPSPETEESARTILRRCCGASSAFVRVNAVAKALGLSSTAIHSQIRQGRFPIAHRRVGHAVLVKFEDLVAWYCANERPQLPDVGVASRVPRTNPSAKDAAVEADEEAPEDVPLFETPAERARRIKKSVLAAMDRQKRSEAASAAGMAPGSGETTKERAERIHMEALAATKPPRARRKP